MTMLEKMARAISDTGYIGERAQSDPDDLAAALVMARAALLAIREPTEAMVEAGKDATWEAGFIVRDSYTTLIDAILIEEAA